jgi:hypothetical protein
MVGNAVPEAAPVVRLRACYRVENVHPIAVADGLCSRPTDPAISMVRGEPAKRNLIGI